MNLNVFTVDDAQAIAAKVQATDKSPKKIAEDGEAEKPGKTPQVSADDVFTKLLKYVPIPIFGTYLAIEGLLLSAFDHYDKVHKVLFLKGSTKEYACWLGFVLFAALVPLYLRRSAVKRGSQILASVIAFVALATASEGPFQLWHNWKSAFGSIMLLLAGVYLVFYKPSPLPPEVINDVNP